MWRVTVRRSGLLAYSHENKDVAFAVARALWSAAKPLRLDWSLKIPKGTAASRKLIHARDAAEAKAIAKASR